MIGPLVIVGDSMLDVDIEGTATRLSPEAPVPVVDAGQRWERPGGAGLAAVLAARTESDVVLVTALGDDPSGRCLAELLAGAGVRVAAMPLMGTTRCKTRIRAGGQSMLRLDHGDGTVADTAVTEKVVRVLREARAICVADYGNGVTSVPRIRDVLGEMCTSVPVVWDPHPRGDAPIPGCALTTPNSAEAQHFCADSTEQVQPGEELRRRWQVHAVCVTHGARGAVLTDRTGDPHHVAVPHGIAVGHPDACGAGDRFAIAATVALASGAGVQEAVAAAVDAAARFVATGGAVGVSTAKPIAAEGGPLGGEDPAISTDVDDIARRLRRRPGTLVATGGCFDLLHTGHVRLLAQARRLGDTLVVLLNSDRSVRALKGASRPIVAEYDRARVLAALSCVDAVCIFDDLSPEQALERLRPDIWVKGGDYAASDLPEASVVRRHGGDVVLLPTVAGYSSSNLIAAARS